jgi:hypothetical protein
MLRLAKGDRVRLFRSTGATFAQGKGGAIGRNGSVLEVFDADDHGITLRNKQGRVGTVRWGNLPTKHGRVQLAYGYAMTIHTAQGSTNREHISALPSGSQAIDGLRGYSAHTRHELKLWLVTSDTAEQIAVRQRRPLNDPRAITLDDKWAQVARALSYQPEKDNALSMFDRVANIRRGAVRAFHDLVPPNVAQQISRSGPTRAHEVARSYRQERSLGDELRAITGRVIDRVRQVQQRVIHWHRERGYEGLSR